MGCRTVFEERTFAVAIFILMAPTALPLPTGGLTYALEITTILLALEMVAGRRTVWLPEKWKARELGEVTTGRAIPAIVRIIRWCERWSRPRGARLIDNGIAWRVLGLRPRRAHHRRACSPRRSPGSTPSPPSAWC